MLLPTNDDRTFTQNVRYYVSNGYTHMTRNRPEEPAELRQWKIDYAVFGVMVALAVVSLIVTVAGSNLDDEVTIMGDEKPFIRPVTDEVTIPLNDPTGRGSWILTPVKPIPEVVVPPVSDEVVSRSFTPGQQFVGSLFVVAGAVGAIAYLYWIGRREEAKSHDGLMEV